VIDKRQAGYEKSKKPERNGRCVMKMIKRSVVIVLVGIVLSGGVLGQTPKRRAAVVPGSRGIYLLRQYLVFSKHNTAFLGFAHNHVEQDLTMEFASLANSAYTCASAVSVLFSIYDQLSCRADRDMAWPLIKAELASQANLLDISAKAVDHNIVTYVKTPAVAAAAARMKKDMEELKAFLETTEKDQQ